MVISNPGAIIAAPFLDQLGVVEALHTYGPPALRSAEITNNIIVNTLRIIVGFPTIHSFSLNSDRSVAVGAGLSLSPRRSRFYEAYAAWCKEGGRRAFAKSTVKELLEHNIGLGITLKELNGHETFRGIRLKEFEPVTSID